MAKNRAFVRYNKKGILAPGSLVVTKNYPSTSGNLWYEVPTHLLGGITLTQSISNSVFPYLAVPGDNFIELGMGCMSNTADWLYVYMPYTKDLNTPADLVSLLNNKVSFLGTFEVGKVNGPNTELLFNLSPQLAEDLNKPQSTDGAPCGFSVGLWNP